MRLDSKIYNCHCLCKTRKAHLTTATFLKINNASVIFVLKKLLLPYILHETTAQAK